MAIKILTESKAIEVLEKAGCPLPLGLFHGTAHWGGGMQAVICDYRQQHAIACCWQIAVYSQDDQLVARFNVR
jgi:hypothetical protein